MQANQQQEVPLKVLMLESSRNWGGQEDRLLREASWLQKHGHRVLLACSDHAAIIGRAGAAGIETRAMSFRSNADLPGLWRLTQLVRKEKPDVIHARSSKDAWFALWFHQAGIPVVRSRHITLPRQMPAGRRFIYRHGARRLIAAATFIGETMRETFRIPGDRIDVIGEAVDTDEFTPGDGGDFRREFDIPPDAPLFGIVAMMRGEKGHITFLDAARLVLNHLPTARFVVVGDAAASSSVKRRIQEIVATQFPDFSTPPVTLTGFRHDIPRIMRALDALVVPSHKEAQSMVIPQAFATGKPVIGSRVGGIPELLQDGINGFLVAPNQPDQLADRMLQLATNPELARRLGREGRAFAEKELAVDVKMQQLLTSYKKAVAPSLTP